jgi:hypothetical protein
MGNSSAGNSITFGGNVNGSTANANSLFMLSGSGAIDVSGSVGNTTALNDFGLGGVIDVTSVSGVTSNYTYTGEAQTFTATYAGIYTFYVWGAQGGNGYNTIGGKGGYAYGDYTLSAGQQISIYVGGLGSRASTASSLGAGWNGGGAGGVDTIGQNGAGGGGATDIRISGTALSNRVIVAGGGAGGGRDGTSGVGGGSSGTSSTNSNSGRAGAGGTQSAGGLAYITSRGATNGSLGQGGAGSTGYYSAGGGGGGGGYFGGGGGTSTENHGSGYSSGGGGGSSYVGGVINGSTIAGNASMPATGAGTQIGQSGNGYARIYLASGTNTAFTPGSQTGAVTIGGVVKAANSCAR